MTELDAGHMAVTLASEAWGQLWGQALFCFVCDFISMAIYLALLESTHTTKPRFWPCRACIAAQRDADAAACAAPMATPHGLLPTCTAALFCMFAVSTTLTVLDGPSAV
jgi:hypothetical protein